MKIRSSSWLRGKRAGATPAHSRAGYSGRSHMEASERDAAHCGDRWVNFAHRNRPISPRAADTTGSCAFSGLNCVPSAQLVVALSRSALVIEAAHSLWKRAGIQLKGVYFGRILWQLTWQIEMALTSGCGCSYSRIESSCRKLAEFPICEFPTLLFVFRRKKKRNHRKLIKKKL